MWKLFKDRVQKEKTLNSELSEDDREVFRSILLQLDSRLRNDAFNKLFMRYSPLECNINIDQTISYRIDKLSRGALKEVIFSYIELFIDISDDHPLVDHKLQVLQIFNEFFQSRGLLYDFQHNTKNNKLEIYPIASEDMKTLHNQTQQLLLEDGWNREAEYISESISQFKKGESGYGSSLKSLYKALEISLKHTIKELNVPKEEYENKTIAPLLGILQTHSFFSGAEADYIRNISDTVLKMGAYVGGKRKAEDHSGRAKKHEVLFCIYGVDNCICYLINQLRSNKTSK